LKVPAGAGKAFKGGGTGVRKSVDASRREDWIAEQLDRGIDVLNCTTRSW